MEKGDGNEMGARDRTINFYALDFEPKLVSKLDTRVLSLLINYGATSSICLHGMLKILAKVEHWEQPKGCTCSFNLDW